MTWFKVDDKFGDHPKVEDCDDLAAVGLWTLMGTWSSSHNTDGRVTRKKALRLSRGDPSLLQELLRCRLVKPAGRHEVLISGFLEQNPSRQEVEGDRERRRELRDPAVKRAVRERDGDSCRYCGVVVNWNDKRSDIGGTYDHVNPVLVAGPENIVVACRGCNGAKGRRTPVEAGMLLRPAPGPENRLKSVPNPDPNSAANPGATARLESPGVMPGRDGSGRVGDQYGAAPEPDRLPGDGAARATAGRAPAEGGTVRRPGRSAGSCPVHHVDLPCRVCAEGESGAVAL